MRSLPPYTCIFWIDDHEAAKTTPAGTRLHEAKIPRSRKFSSATEGMDWLIAAAKSHPAFTGEVEIFDSIGSCLYSDILTSYNPSEADHVAS